VAALVMLSFQQAGHMVGERQHGKLSKKKVEAEEEEIHMWDMVWVCD